MLAAILAAVDGRAKILVAGGTMQALADKDSLALAD